MSFNIPAGSDSEKEEANEEPLLLELLLLLTVEVLLCERER